VANNEVQTLTVITPDWNRVLPGDMLKKMGVWSLLMTQTLTTIVCSYHNFGKINEVNRLSAQNLRRRTLLAFMCYLPEHNSVCIAEVPHGKGFCFLCISSKSYTDLVFLQR
jgi:hypothetical protein